MRRGTPPALRSTALGFVALGLSILALVLGALSMVLFVAPPEARTLVSPAFAVGSVVGIAALTTGIVAMSTHRGQMPGALGTMLALLAAVLPHLPYVIGWSPLVFLSLIIGV